MNYKLNFNRIEAILCVCVRLERSPIQYRIVPATLGKTKRRKCSQLWAVGIYATHHSGWLMRYRLMNLCAHTWYHFHRNSHVQQTRNFTVAARFVHDVCVCVCTVWLWLYDVRDRNIAATIGTNTELTLEFIIIINEFVCIEIGVIHTATMTTTTTTSEFNLFRWRNNFMAKWQSNWDGSDCEKYIVCAHMGIGHMAMESVSRPRQLADQIYRNGWTGRHELANSVEFQSKIARRMCGAECGDSCHATWTHNNEWLENDWGPI